MTSTFSEPRLPHQPLQLLDLTELLDRVLDEVIVEDGVVESGIDRADVNTPVLPCEVRATRDCCATEAPIKPLKGRRDHGPRRGKAVLEGSLILRREELQDRGWVVYI